MKNHKLQVCWGTMALVAKEEKPKTMGSPTSELANIGSRLLIKVFSIYVGMVVQWLVILSGFAMAA